MKQRLITDFSVPYDYITTVIDARHIIGKLLSWDEKNKEVFTEEELNLIKECKELLHEKLHGHRDKEL